MTEAVVLWMWVWTAFAADGVQGVWTSNWGTLVLEEGGQATVVRGGTRFVGRYAFQDGVLQLATPAGTALFQVQRGAGSMVLTDMYGQMIQFSESAPQAREVTAESKKKLSSKQFRKLLETWETEDPTALFRAVGRLSDAQLQMLSIWSAAGSVIHTRACQAPEAAGAVLRWPLEGPWTCDHVLQQHQMAAQWTADPWSFGRSQVGEVLIVSKCDSGELSSGSCAAYAEAKGTANATLQATGEAILEMTRPPPCTDYYDPNGTHLGCW